MTEIICILLLLVATTCIIWLLRPLRNPTYYRCHECGSWFNELGEVSSGLPEDANYDPTPGCTCFLCVEEQERQRAHQQ